MNSSDPLLAPMVGAEHRLVGGVQLDYMQTGAARVKRVIYPPGFKWSVDLKPIIGTELCMHAHAGFLAKGQLRIQYADGFVEDFIAPQIVSIEPGHDGWVVGEEPAVLIEFDFQGETVQHLQIPQVHSADQAPLA
ncbi:cupin domain-containing protein [Adhaeribacter swui]|uniref:hypothetical protein n=1 Tax=Adhaeribacter swui TaxID=2086471 RepID=UPI001E28F8FF|nr:hypothetical protein [Adhaeribacter swui]